MRIPRIVVPVVASALTAFFASPVGALDVVDLGTLTSNLSAYNGYVTKCQAYVAGLVGDTAGLCNISDSAPKANDGPTDPPGTATLFSWGTFDDSVTSVNSVRTLTYTGTRSLKLDTTAGIVLTTQAGSVGGAVPGVMLAGTGANATWEWGGTTGAPTAVETLTTTLEEAKFRITIASSSAEFGIFKNSTGSENWFNSSDPDDYVRQTPLSGATYGNGTYSPVLNKNDTVTFRFFGTDWEGNLAAVTAAGGAARYPTGIPDVAFAPMDVQLAGAYVDPTLTLDKPTLDFDARRTDSGASTSGLNIRVTNTGVAGTRLTGSATTGGAPFSGGTASISVMTGAGNYQDVNFNFTALGAINGATTAVKTPGTASFTTNGSGGGLGSATLNGYTVSPSLSMKNAAGTVISNNGTGVIVAFGNVRQGTQNSTPTGASPKITNAFTSDLGDRTRLTIGATEGAGGFSFNPALTNQKLASGQSTADGVAAVTFNAKDLDRKGYDEVLKIKTDQDAVYEDTTNGTTFSYHATATVVGPVFDMSGADVKSATLVDLGTVDVGNARTSDILTILNIFGTNLGQTLTDLSLLNIGWEGGSNALFKLDAPQSGSVTDLVAHTPSSWYKYTITFNEPRTLLAPGTYERMLLIQTDTNAAFQGDGTDYRITVRASVVNTPVPASYLLLMLGLGALRWSQSRRLG